MGRIPIVAKDRSPLGKSPQQRQPCYLISRPLPIFYMSEFSVLGLLVDRLEEAIGVLDRNHFSVTQEAGDIEVAVDTPDHLQEMFQVLKANGVLFEIADMVNGIYQG
jgi:hypothetical protein